MLDRSNVPIMIISDSPAVPTGLGRITRDLATRVHQHLGQQFRVATFGLGGSYTGQLPFAQYQLLPTAGSLTPGNFPETWRDFLGSSPERGVVLAIGNPTWLLWLSHPESLPEGSALRSFLESDPFDKWLYAPIDGDGPGARLPGEMAEALTGWDRVLAYNQYGAKLIDDAINACQAGQSAKNGTACTTYMIDSNIRVPHLPHGIDTSQFYPRPRAQARETFLRRIAGAGQAGSPFTAEAKIDDDMLLIGAVATNSERKDWYLAMETCHELLTRHGQNVVLWGHSNMAWKHWNIPALARDFGLGHRLVLTTTALTNDQLAWGYSALDCSLGIGSGEGYGYPLAESLACGVPVLHSNYAGGASFVPPKFLIEPVAYRGEGFYGIRRPVHTGAAWADRVMEVKGTPASLPTYMDWQVAWQGWSDWLLQGVTK